ncbi:PglY protein [Saccharothrix sp. HUAS TT1]|uniref:PglY protein n=1 Tax=unclassified Saccharothrix TaxID=2593673 RepID=UPI00345B5968
MSTAEMYLRDVIHIPESVHAGDFKVELSGGFTETDARVSEYVVTDQLQAAFRKALSVVRAAVRDGNSHAAYLHGSFGSGKSHFLTVLHAVLHNEPSAREKTGLQPVIAENDDWLGGKKFLMVPYHLVGAADIDSAILGGYVATTRKLHPDKPTPAVYRSDAMLADARRQREFLADDGKFAQWLESGTPQESGDEDDLDPIDSVSTWTTAKLDQAFTAPQGDTLRSALESALLSGPMSSYTRGASGDQQAFIPLENGLAVISRHARDVLHYDGIILFLDEMILWLQANMKDQRFVNNQVSKLVKLIESGDADRVLPIVSFISRQRDLSKLVGEDVTGAEMKNLEAQVNYLAGRFDVVELEDRNLPAIIKERVLKPVSPQARTALDEAFATIESANALSRDVLLDSGGVTGATWAEFRDVYPLSPALLNVLVTLSGALQRERTGLKLLQEMLRRRRADMKLGELIPLGDLWDVLSDGTGEAFTDKLKREADAAHRFHSKVRAHLLEKYGSEGDTRFVQDDRLVKTLLLASLAPAVPALSRLTGARLAALNHGSIRSRVGTPASVVVQRLRALQAEFGELRSEGDEDPVFSLHLSDLDIEPLLEKVGEQDSLGARRVWIKDQLWQALGVKDSQEFVSEREVVWRGTRRVAEFVFGNVRDHSDLPDMQFTPSVDGRVRFVLDYPFDAAGAPPVDDARRVQKLKREGTEAATVVWLPHFLSSQKSGQLGRLLKINYLLERDRLDDHAANLSTDDRIRVRHQLQAQKDNLTTQLRAALQQLYGISGGDEGTIGAEVGEDGHVLSLLPSHKPRLHGGAAFEYNLLALADSAFDVLYPKHPDFDVTRSRKPVTTGELRTVLKWVTEAQESGNQRIVVDRKDLALVRKIAHPLELGEVSDGPLNLSTEWRKRIEQHASREGVTGDFDVEKIRSWIAAMGWTGLDKPVANLIIATYALLSDRAWLYNGGPTNPPELERIGPGFSLRAQELPTPDEFTAAREKAGALFGVHVPDARFARNVAKLAGEVRAKVVELEPAVGGVHKSLQRHAEELGVDPMQGRARTARDAADVLAVLSGEQEPTKLLRALAGVSYQATSEVMSRALTSAPKVLAALDGVDWSLLASTREFVGRPDSAGEMASRLVDDVRQAAEADQLVRDLVPVLGSVQSRAVAVMKEAARSTPAPPPIPPAPNPTPPTGGAGGISLTNTGSPPVSGSGGTSGSGPIVSEPVPPTPPPGPRASRATRRVAPTAVEAELGRLVEEMRREVADYARQHPGAEIEITLRVVGPESGS